MVADGIEETDKGSVVTTGEREGRIVFWLLSIDDRLAPKEVFSDREVSDAVALVHAMLRSNEL